MIRNISQKQASTLIDRFNNDTMLDSDYGLFLCISKNKNSEMLLTAVDNSIGDCLFEDFRTETIAKDWLENKDYGVAEALHDDKEMYELLKMYEV